MIANKPPDISDSFGCVIFWHDDDLTNVLAADDCFHSDASKGVVSSMRSWVICLSHLCAVCILCISKTDYKTEACTDGKLCSWVPTYSVYSMCCSRIAFMLMPPWLYADACEYQTSALFFCYSDTITFYYLPLIFHVMINLALILILHLREMIRGCKLCDSLICLFLPLSLSCSPSFRTVTYGRQLCREPQSVFTLSCTLSHTAAQLPTLLRACSSLPASSHVSFHSFFFLWWSHTAATCFFLSSCCPAGGVTVNC